MMPIEKDLPENSSSMWAANHWNFSYRKHETIIREPYIQGKSLQAVYPPKDYQTMALLFSSISVSQPQKDRLGFQIVVQAVVNSFSSDSTCFKSPERQVEGARWARAVDTDGSSLHIDGKAHGSTHISGVDGSIESVLGGVDHTNHLILRSEHIDINHGPKDLLFHNLGILWCPYEDGRRNEVSFVIRDIVSKYEFTISLSQLNVAFHAVKLSFVRLWPVIDVRIGRIAKRDRLEVLFEQRDEPVCNRGMDIDSRIGHAYLTTVPLDAIRRLFGGISEIRIAEYNRRRLAS